MSTSDPAPAIPDISVVIAVYNDWKPLDQCLRSLAQQTYAPAFEVIVVDDGSTNTTPANIVELARTLPLTVARQPHAGVSAARNHGVSISRGALIVFADADSKLEPDCLSSLAATVASSPQHNSFQLHLLGDESSSVGRAEELRLTTIQNHMLQPNGCIRYLNTAGFAIRRSSIDPSVDLFDTVALRAEDTLLLVNLMQRGEMPLFVPAAKVHHAVPLTLLQYLRKSVRSAYIERGTYRIIAAKGVRIRVTNRERLNMLSAMWKTAKNPAIGRGAWFVLVVRQAIPRIVSFVCRITEFGSPAPTAKPSN